MSWLEADRAALLLRESIREAAQEWERHNQDESYLAHSGRRLAEAEALAHHPRFTLNTQEQAYLDAAVALRGREEQEREAQRQRELTAQRERAEMAEQRVAEQAIAARRLRRRFLVAAGLGALALLAAIGAFWGFRQAGEQQAVAEKQRIVAVAAAGTAEAESARADEQATVARLRALSAQARIQHDFGEDERGALLARQAYLFDQRSGNALRDEVDEALRAALGPNHFSRILYGHQDVVTSVASSSDGQHLASGSEDGTVRYWDLAHLATPLILKDNDGPVTSVAFSPEGQTLAAGGWDGTVRLWSLSDPAAAPTILERHEAGVLSIAFNPDGQRLASGSEDGTIHLWNLTDPATTPIILDGHEASVLSVAFSPDGQSLASGSEDGTMLGLGLGRSCRPRRPQGT